MRERLARYATAVTRLSKASFALVAALVALGVSTVSFAFDLWPHLRPDPQRVRAGSMAVQAIEPQVTYGDYLKRVGERPVGATPDDLKTRGYVLDVRINVQGRKHEPLKLGQVLYDARTHRRLPGQGNTLASRLRVDVPNDQWIEQIFVPKAFTSPAITRVLLYDGDVILAATDSRALRP